MSVEFPPPRQINPLPSIILLAMTLTAGFLIGLAVGMWIMC